jgi:ATP-dependent DNA ligase
MTLELKTPFTPMEAQLVEKPPEGNAWQYEPKWDGFRCLAFRDDKRVQLQSKSGRPLARYFPDLVESLLAVRARKFVLDGEIVIPIAGRLSFDDLLMRVHPAESRVRKLAAEHPALLIVFDLLVNERGKSLVNLKLDERRSRLETFAAHYFPANAVLRLSPITTDLVEARKWFRSVGGNLDGIVAKRRDLPYRSGTRDGMQKVKHQRTADCVVGGFRYAQESERPPGRQSIRKTKQIGSLLLGLYDEKGLLDHIGFTSGFNAAERTRVTKMVTPLIGGSGFTGHAPGGPSRWSTRLSDDWKPLKPDLVVEVQYDHFTGDRFRHGTRILRWRPDKAPRQCTLDQVDRRAGPPLKLLEPSTAIPKASHGRQSAGSATIRKKTKE